MLHVPIFHYRFCFIGTDTSRLVIFLCQFNNSAKHCTSSKGKMFFDSSRIIFNLILILKSPIIICLLKFTKTNITGILVYFTDYFDK